MMTMTMMMICIVWLLRPTTLPKSAVLVGGEGGVGGWQGLPGPLCSALVQHRGQPGNRFLPPLPTHSSATLLICSSSRAMPPMYLLESTIGEQLELLPVQPLRNNQVFPTSVNLQNLIIILSLAKYELQTMRLAGWVFLFLKCLVISVQQITKYFSAPLCVWTNEFLKCVLHLGRIQSILTA